MKLLSSTIIVLISLVIAGSSHPRLFRVNVEDETIIKFELKSTVSFLAPKEYVFKKNIYECKFIKYGYVHTRVNWSSIWGNIQAMIGIYDCGKTEFNVGNSTVNNLLIDINYGNIDHNVDFDHVERAIMDNINHNHIFTAMEMEHIKTFIGHQKCKWKTFIEKDLEMIIRMDKHHPNRIYFVKDDKDSAETYQRDNFPYRIFNKSYDRLEKLFHLEKINEN